MIFSELYIYLLCMTDIYVEGLFKELAYIRIVEHQVIESVFRI